MTGSLVRQVEAEASVPNRRVPRVDVIVPCYNYGRFLRACLGSVLDQTGCQVRALVIDDCSTDDSLDIARAIAAEDSRVQVLAHAVNRGHIATYNEGIEWLASDYMLLLSSDDMLAPGAFARAIDMMEAEPSISFVWGPAIQFSQETELSTQLEHRPQPPGRGRLLRGPDFVRGFCLKPVNSIETATAIVRTCLQKKVGGYRPELPHAGDMEMWLRLAAHGDVGVLPDVQAYTRIHARNMRHGYKADRMRSDYEQRHLAFRMFFDSHSEKLEDAENLEKLARRSVAEEVLWSAARHFEEAKEDAATARLMDLAPAIDPSILWTPLWWKTSIKRAVGPRWWRALEPALTKLKRISA
jgi:glycosyltransferase involved in cell wall biosynthesis